MQNSECPRTEAAINAEAATAQARWLRVCECARQLERELNAALKLTNINVESELLQRTKERDQLRREVSEAKEYIERLSDSFAKDSANRTNELQNLRRENEELKAGLAPIA